MNTKFQTGEMVRATQGAGRFFASGDVGRVIRHATDGTVKVDWSAGNNPKGHYGDGEWWAKESELVRLTEAPPAKLTLPIVVGKKYVRGDGEIVEIIGMDGDWADARCGSCYWASHGGFFSRREQTVNLNLESDYIEPAKGHPHAALMMEFAKDAAETETPWQRWEVKTPSGWCAFDSAPSWHPSNEYRRRPTVTPDPHAENAAEYAKDMAETDKAWERWEYKFRNEDWISISHHPAWDKNTQYRRKEQQ